MPGNVTLQSLPRESVVRADVGGGTAGDPLCVERRRLFRLPGRGEGPVDLVYLQGFLSNVGLNWEHPAFARFARELSRFSRLIVTDRRGLDCGFIAMPFAATYPDRIAALILHEAAPTPGGCLADSQRYGRTDVRGVLPSIQVPTLVLHRSDDPEEAQNSLYLTSRIRTAKLVELPGYDHFPWAVHQDAVVQEVERFLATVRAEEAELDRVLATVLFTDIVRSTEKVAELGDAGWRDLVERHHSTVRALLARYRGREIDTAGDGFFASFDGPARALRRGGRRGCQAARDRDPSGPPHWRGRDDRGQSWGHRRQHWRSGRRHGPHFRGARLADREGPRRRFRT